MKVTTDGDRAVLHLETYEDLLTARALPEWRMSGPDTAETRVPHLEAIGLGEKVKKSKRLKFPLHLFDYQEWIVAMALERHRFAVFADTGLGKTLVQLEWARQVMHASKGRVLIVAPLNIVSQTISEAAKFYGSRLPVDDVRDRAALAAWLSNGSGIGITNYEKIDGVEEPLAVDGVVLDESSVLKQSLGSRRTSLIKAFKGVPWKLCCSATPAPNDRIEYAEHAFFLDVVRSTREFLAGWFVNRDGKWQLKRHGIEKFYKHLASWSVFMRDPTAYGFSDNTADLPEIREDFPAIQLTDEQIQAANRWNRAPQLSLMGADVGGIVSRTKVQQIANGFELKDGKVLARFASDKPRWIVDLCNRVHGDEAVLVWVQFDLEGDQLAEMIPGSVHLSGRTPRPQRDRVIEDFRLGKGARVLIAKPSMFGFGLNLQACRVQVFSTVTDSFERRYQAIRRSYRYGQTRPVVIYTPLTPLDEAMCQNVLNKQDVWKRDAGRQEQAYVEVLRPKDSTERRVFVTDPQAEISRTQGDSWTLVQGDCIAHMPTMDEESMDLAVFSPPFANLFTYSSEAADMGNVRDDHEYRLQWRFFAERLIRVMKPGRVVAVHAMDVIRFAGQHGHRYTYDYPSDIRAGMQAAGFRYHARIAIDKNPQIQATRTKDANLLFVTLKRNALDSHPQASECVLVFRKPGESEAKVHAMDISNEEWVTWAHHVWYGIRETDVLNAALGKDADDERHICPLQLSLIERCVRLWTNPDEVVFSPFAGIGSEGYEALSWSRGFYGIELKDSYFKTATRFLSEKAKELESRLSLFGPSTS